MAYDPGDIIVRCVMSAATGLPEDRIVNDFAFKLGVPALTPDEAQLLALQDAVDKFYNHESAGTDPTRVSYYISDYIPRNVTHEMLFYAPLAGGSPIFQNDWLGPQAAQAVNNGLPQEVAAVLSYHADLSGSLEEVGATRPRARRRGRVYVGPLTTFASTGLAQATLNTTFLAAMRTGAIKMHDDAELAGFDWCVHSRVDATLRDVVGGWTDNAFDSQRRRGMGATLRTVYTV